jgi:glycosyltransferase family protein
MKKILKYYYWLFRTYPQRKGFPKIKIMNALETIDAILNGQKCVSRFGDGELRLMIGQGKIIFQEADHRLADRLKEVLQSDIKNLIITMPKPLSSVNFLTLNSKYFWIGFLNLYGRQLSPYLKKKYLYGDTGVTRFYMGLKDKNQSRIIAEKLKTIWDKKEVLIIEGEFSRMGVGNDLYNNAASIQRIICPSENAFKSYDEILQLAKEYGKGKLILIALGPTASILSYDLAKDGYWAIDIGHIDVEYMWMLLNATKKVPIKGRYVSEAISEKDFEIPAEYREAYNSSIIHRVP